MLAPDINQCPNYNADMGSCVSNNKVCGFSMESGDKKEGKKNIKENHDGMNNIIKNESYKKQAGPEYRIPAYLLKSLPAFELHSHLINTKHIPDHAWPLAQSNNLFHQSPASW